MKRETEDRLNEMNPTDRLETILAIRLLTETVSSPHVDRNKVLAELARREYETREELTKTDD